MLIAYESDRMCLKPWGRSGVAVHACHPCILEAEAGSLKGGGLAWDME